MILVLTCLTAFHFVVNYAQSFIESYSISNQPVWLDI